jgi:dipeptidyl aminopeptidase/acylaminoacyl peptidase
MVQPSFLHQLLHLPSVQYARLSPDRRWVAFVWYRVHENMDVFVVPTDGSSPPVALTHTPELTWFVSWTPDSGAVIVEEDHESDERVRLFRVGIDNPLEMQPLTEDRPPYFLRGGDLHPDGKTLFYGANYDFSTKSVLEPTWVYRHDLRTGERVLIAQPKNPAYVQVSLNREGTHLLYSSKDRHPAGRQIYLVDVEGKSDREILNFGDEVKVYARWFPDSARLMVLSESVDGRAQDHQSLGVYHLQSEDLQWLIDDPQRMIEGAWVTPGGLIVVDEICNANHTPSYLEVEGGVEVPFPRTQGNLLPLGRALDGTWIAMHYSSKSPSDLVRVPLESGELESLTGVWGRTEILPGALKPAEAFHWLSEDGLQIQGWLYRAQPNPRRAVITIHGGPSSHSEDRLNPQIQYFVSKGFNVLDVNYRGSTGFGLKFREAIKEDGWGGREQADIVAGAQALIKAGLADPGKIGVTGTSYGGYSAWCMITRYPRDLIGAAAPVCGMTDLVVDYETTRPDLRPLSEEMMGGSPAEMPEKYFERSPINFVSNIHGKLLIVQGAKDPNVTPENVRQVCTHLDESSISYDLLVFDDEGHGIIKPENQERLYQRLVDFFDRALR